MVYVSCFEDKLCLWWDDREDKKAGMRYKITVDGQNCAYTNNRYYDFKNLEENREYHFQIQVVDERDTAVGRTDSLSASTLPLKKRVNVALPPYNAIGDGKTDNTSIIQRAIDENSGDTELYLPLGIYLCGKLRFSGGYNLRLDAGAILQTPNEKEINDA